MKINIEVTGEEVQEFTTILTDCLDYYSTLSDGKEENFKRLFLIIALSKRINQAYSAEVDASIKKMGL